MSLYDRIAESWYNVRHWTIFRQELEKLSREWHGSLLNIGCAHGADFLPFPPEKFRFFGLDSSRELVLLSRKYAAKNSLVFRNLVADMRAIPLRDSSMDYIICMATLHHLLRREDRLKALKEMKRVLKRQAFLTVWDRENPDLPCRETIEKKWGDQTRKYYLYTKEELEKELKEAGFYGKVWSDKRNIMALIKLK